MFRPQRYESAKIVHVGNLWYKDRPCGETFGASIVIVGKPLEKALVQASSRRDNTFTKGSRGAKLLVPNSKSGATSAKWSLAPEMPWHQNKVRVVWHQNSDAISFF
ncbi:hypothetical protein Tco_0850705 [Tanacetum coccineum]